MQVGTKLGAYEVIAKLGEGGMGEVYRARDTTLGRNVAIKILPDLFADDPDRLARFEREARTLASLNHPNIAQIYGLEGTPRALVMELVEGEDLSVRLARGPMPLSEALPVAKQVADAVEAAHDQGIIHRDLKPANIKVRPDGTVKVLDFGLARAMTAGSDSAAGVNAQSSPTFTAHGTLMGMIVGTAAYMAPEQARGRAVDRRADIWAFGCVLFEMLSGCRPFSGSDVSETLATVIKDEPPWGVLPPDLPDPLRRLLRRCLEKDPRRRLSSIGDARLELEEPAVPASPSAGPTSPRARSSAGWIVAAIMTIVAAGTAIWAVWVRGSAVAPLMRVTVQAPREHRLYRDPANIAISPDGTRVAFVTGASRSDATLWVRGLDRLDAVAIEDSVGAQLPFWSPDSAMVGFFAEGHLKVVSPGGGAPQILADAPDGRGASWGSNGDIVFAAANAGPILRVSANGGAVTTATELRTADGETGHRFPWFLPDGTHFLFAAVPSKSNQFAIYSAAVGSTARELVLTAETAPLYADPGYLIYSRKGVLVAHPFDARSRTVSGEAISIGDMPGEVNLEYSAGWAASVSRTGSLIYLSAAQSRSRLAWLDQTGREVGAVNVPPAPYFGVGLARDGQQAVVAQLSAPRSSLWLADLIRGGLTPIAEATAFHSNPIWSGDGRHVVFGTDRAGPVDLHIWDVSAARDEVLYESESLFKYPASWSADGRTIVFTDARPDTGNDLWTIAPFGDRTPVPFLRTRAEETYGAISPDGRWIAYHSNHAGAFDVYVQPFPGGGNPVRVTTTRTLDWGLWWKRDGSQLLILGGRLDLVLVDVRLTPTFAVGATRVVGKLNFPIIAANSIDATDDLGRLLAAIPEADGARFMTVVLNWRTRDAQQRP
ncbi:MAG: protein kinase [Burkholderiaceae bacterium]